MTQPTKDGQTTGSGSSGSSPPSSQSRSVRLGCTQRLVLRLISLHNAAPTIRDLAYDWPSLTQSSVSGALNRLAHRGLVDVAGFSPASNARTYKLTSRGQTVLTEIDSDDWEV